MFPFKVKLKIIILILSILSFSSIVYAQDNPIEDILNKLKSNDVTTILEGIDDAGLKVVPNGEILQQLKALILRSDSDKIVIEAIKLVGKYAVYLNNSSIVEFLWVLVKKKDNTNIVEQCYITLTYIIPKLGGFPEEDSDLIYDILKSYQENETHALLSGLKFFACVINALHKTNLILKLTEYLDSSKIVEAHVLEAATIAYSMLYSKFTLNLKEEQIFTSNELQIGANYLVELLVHYELNIRKHAVIALGNCQFSKDLAINRLIKMLSNDDTSVRHECAIALGKIGSDSVLDSLYNAALDDRNKIVQAAALEGLSYIPEKVDLKKIKHLNNDYNYKIRENFLKIIVAIIRVKQDKGLLQYLNYAVNTNDNGNVIVQAALGYGELPLEENLYYLEKLLNYEEGNYNSFVRINACKSLSKHQYKKSEEVLLRRLNIEKNLYVIIAIFNALGILKYQTSVDEISNFFTHDNSMILISALISVAEIGGEEGKDALLEFVKKYPDSIGYDSAISLLQGKMNVDKMEILKETNIGKYYYEAAKQKYNEAAKKPDNPRIYEEIISEIDKAIEYNPNLANAYYIRGICKYKLKEKYDIQEAIDDLEKALELGFSHVTIYKGIGKMYYAIQRYDKAIEYFNQYIINTNDEDPTAYLLLANAQASNMQYDDALNTTYIYQNMNPEDPKIVKLLANIYYLKQDWANAILYMEQYLKNETNDDFARCELGKSYINIGEYEKAIETFNIVIKRTQNQYPKAYYWLGIAYLGIYNYDYAKTYLEKFIENADPIKDKWFIESAKLFLSDLEEIDNNG